MHWKVAVAVALGLCACASAVALERPVGGDGATMRYLANSSDPGIGSTWVQPGFDDSGWTVGAYGVGYDLGGDADELLTTTVPGDTLSVYTRFTFELADPSSVGALHFGADYDDGVVVWLNGVEIWRSPEMPAGAPAWDTPAALHESSNAWEPDYGTFVDVGAAGLGALTAGTNTVAVGAWNATPPSGDLVLVPRLELDRAVSVVRRPYLQMGTSSSIVVRWRTDTAQASRVDVGLAPGALGTTVSDPTPVTDHEITLGGLSAGTRYHYAIGNASGLLIGDDDAHFFDTPPPPGTAAPLRIWALGDSGRAGLAVRGVRDGFYAHTGASNVDLWMMLGDNAYESGTDAEYQASVFDVFPSTLRTSVLWPTIGNHEAYVSDSPTESGPYFEIFSLPTAAEAGGVASATEAYYSFDVGNVHVVVLDSADSVLTPAGDMLTWLQQDLQANTRDWLIAIWHHPPYSKGSHDSDTEARLYLMRENALPLLESHGVDLVLTGHSHAYERTPLLDGHYGDSATFGPAFVVDGGDGREAGDGAYLKSAVGPQPNEGAVYVVAGNASELRTGPLNHPAMYVSLTRLGSMLLEFDGARLDVALIGDDASVIDSFTVAKGPYCPSGTDGDGDFACDPDDNCPATPNADQLDGDGDGAGDACDACPADPGNDPDADGVCAAADNCPALANPAQADADADGLGDACDDCPADPTNDPDADGVCDDVDNCPGQFNPCQLDRDTDGVGDVCDSSSPTACNVFADRDTYLDEDQPNRQNGNEDELRSQNRNGQTTWPLFGYDLSPVPAGASIARATAWFHSLESQPNATTDVRRVDVPWTEQSATWSTVASGVAATVEGSFTPPAAGWADVDVTALVDGWSTGTIEEHGLALVATATTREALYASIEFEVPGFEACMEVVYVCLLPGSDSDGDGTPDENDGCPNDPGKIAPGGCGCGVADVDGDGDGTLDCDDGCPADPGKIAPGSCGCGTAETDGDGDGIADCVDTCPADPFDDADADGVCGDVDNCPAVANAGQADDDADGAGDPCDACPLDDGDDADADGVCGDVDVCPAIADPDQADADGDGIGDACEPCSNDADDDADADGVCGDVDNCPGTANADQVDSDGNGVGDACQTGDDADADGVPDQADNCPATSNPLQRDADQDGVGDACDVDRDGDGVADTADCAPGSRGVSVAPGEIGTTLRAAREPGGALLTWRRAWQGHVSDVYRGARLAGGAWDPSLVCVEYATPHETSLRPDVPPPGGLYFYLVGAANVCGASGLGAASGGARAAAMPGCPYGVADADGDGIADREDHCPIDHDPALGDLDGDMVGDPCDVCPSVADPAQSDGDGDGRGDACEDLADQDQDNDGIEDGVDNCRQVANTDQTDTDGDGTGDVCDNCPATSNPFQEDVDVDGAGDVCDNCPATVNVSQSDIDGDGAGDACDPCPADPGDDSDGDGTCASDDNCPTIANPSQADGDSDGIGDACDPCPADAANDVDADGVCGNVDNCPAIANPCQLDADADGTGDVCEPPDPAACVAFTDRDTYIEEQQPNSSNGNDEELLSRTDDGRDRRPLIGYDLSAVPAGHEVVRATAYLWVVETDDAPVEVQRVTEAWTEGDATWAQLETSFDPAVVGTFVPDTPEAWVAVDVTSLVGDWHDGTLPDHGIALRSTSLDVESRFASREGQQNGKGEISCLEVVTRCDVAIADSDGDGTPDVDDPCPFDADDDLDADGLCGDVDNCPATANPAQADADADGVGDVCDPCPGDTVNDPDGDGLCGAVDNCPTVSNACQADVDGDGIGDACETPGPANCLVFVDQDAWIEQGSSSTNHGAATELSARTVPFGGKRPIYRYDLSSLPAGVEVASATAWFRVTDPETSEEPIGLHRITASWTETDASWDTLEASYESTAAATFAAPASGEWAAADLTGLLGEWLAGTQPNHGVTLRPTSFGSESKFTSREWTPVEERPCIEVVTTCSP